MEKLFLFDFDGVIVDSLDVYERRVRLCLEKMDSNVVKSREDFLALFEDNFYEAIEKRGVDVLEFMKASRALPIEDDYDQMIPFAPMLPVLEKLKKDHILVVISSNVSHIIHAILSKYRYDALFREVLGTEAGFSKQDKIRNAMTRFHTKTDSAYYIGDTVGDMKEARLAGARTVAVTWGWHDRTRFEKVQPDYIPDYIIETPEELLHI